MAHSSNRNLLSPVSFIQYELSISWLLHPIQSWTLEILIYLIPPGLLDQSSIFPPAIIPLGNLELDFFYTYFLSMPAQLSWELALLLVHLSSKPMLVGNLHFSISIFLRIFPPPCSCLIILGTYSPLCSITLETCSPLCSIIMGTCSPPCSILPGACSHPCSIILGTCSLRGSFFLSFSFLFSWDLSLLMT